MCDHPEQDCDTVRELIRKALRSAAVRNVTMKSKADMVGEGLPLPQGDDDEWFRAGIAAGVTNTLALLDADTLFEGHGQ